MIRELDAIAFDIDGTLYPNPGLYRLLGSFLLSHTPFLIKFGLVREKIRNWQKLHPGESHSDFFGWQAELMAPLLHTSPAKAREATEHLIYEGWKPLFNRVRPYSGVRDAFFAFKKAGLRIGLLSDFLPSQKGEMWGLLPLCDVVLGSEEAGALKPSPVPFRMLIQALDVPAERILYVGNSVKTDLRGAAAVGMKTALIRHFPTVNKRFPATDDEHLSCADIYFSSYRQLTGIVLK